jgi:hypothetical protein
MAGLGALEKRQFYEDYCEIIELYTTSGCRGSDGEDHRLLGCGAM